MSEQSVATSRPLAIFNQKIRADIQAARRASGFRVSARHVVLFSPGFHLLLSIRLQELVAHVPVIGHGLRLVLWYFSSIYHSCGISMGAKIEGGACFPHPVAIVLAEQSHIGKNVTIYQSVTLGRSYHGPVSDVQIIGDNVVIGAGAVIIGNVVIGEHARIGANAVVLQNVPAYATAVGNPARIIRKQNRPSVVAQSS